jgi:hypothetical protein
MVAGSLLSFGGGLCSVLLWAVSLFLLAFAVSSLEDVAEGWRADEHDWGGVALAALAVAYAVLTGFGAWGLWP